MSIQSTSFNPLLAQQAGSSPTISALNAGTVFDGQGNDFLSPSNIMGNVDDFSQSIRFGGDALGKNPSAVDVLGNTNSTLSGILTGSFGVNLAAPIVSAPSGGIVGVSTPVAITQQSTQGTVTTNTTLLGQAVQTPSPALIRDLSNYNPLIWQNPSPSNILLGSMDAQNKIFGGSGLFQTGSATQSGLSQIGLSTQPSLFQTGTSNNFNQFPLYPYIGLPNAPYSGININIPTQGGVTNYQQAALFPTTFVTGSPFYNTYFQPYAVATTQTVTPYQTQVGLAELILGQSGATSSQMLSSLTSVSSNGVPPWISE
jgi:hypothetical protein